MGSRNCLPILPNLKVKPIFMNEKNQKILIITGLSGAGMSLSLKNLEDLGYDVFDNFPLAMLDGLLQDSYKINNPIAFGISTRTRKFNSEDVLAVVKQVNATLIFLTADDNILQRRFSETRRYHSMAKACPVSDGIRKEQEMLFNLKVGADLIIDTSDLTIHDLRRLLENYFWPENRGNLIITLISFGFHRGFPREADIVMDVRFLRNPYWVKELKHLDGRDQAVGAYIELDENFTPFLQKFEDMLGLLLPRYIQEGKKYLTVAFGCSGGRHRSVFAIEKLKPRLEDPGFSVHVIHRDIEHLC